MADIIVPMYTLLDPTRAQDFAIKDEELFNLVQTFEKSLLEDKKSLFESAQNKNQDDLHRNLHTLKGYLPFLCRADFCERITELYQMVRGNQLDLVLSGVMAIMPSLNVLQIEIGDWLTSYDSKKG
ncbi:MAG: hypothetical protein WCO80_01465 [Betaproteobacteria bacterium]|jgi:hypothetical protein|nr:hypothetical protein [Betaproteobacteria bacterium]NBT66989.1 hypothetical protein [Betaproteobacteria bacterium]NBY08118.1 hypothetical protein [Betaproteobacteria bacterium]